MLQPMQVDRLRSPNNNSNSLIDVPKENNDDNKNEHAFSDLPCEQLKEEFIKLGYWCESEGFNLEQLSQKELPPLDQEGKERLSEILSSTTTLTFEEIENTITVPFNFVPNLVNKHIENKNSETTIVGGAVRYIYGFKRALQALTTLLGIENPLQFVSPSLRKKFSNLPNDIDVRIYCEELEKKDFQELKKKIVKTTVAQLPKDLKNRYKIVKDNAFTNLYYHNGKLAELLTIGIGKNDYVIVKKSRPYLFSSTCLNINLSTQEIESDWLGGWPAFFTLFTKTIIIENPKTVNHYGWVRLMSDLSLGYALWRESSEETIRSTMIKYLNGDDSKLFHLIDKTVKNHHHGSAISSLFICLNSSCYLEKSFDKEAVNVLFRSRLSYPSDEENLACKFSHAVIRLLKEKKATLGEVRALITIAALPHFSRSYNEKGSLEYSTRKHMGKLHLQLRVKDSDKQLYALLLPIDLEDAFLTLKNSSMEEFAELFQILTSEAYTQSSGSRLEKWNAITANWSPSIENEEHPLINCLTRQFQIAEAIQNNDRMTLFDQLVSLTTDPIRKKYKEVACLMIQEIAFFLDMEEKKPWPHSKEDALIEILKTGDPKALTFVKKEKENLKKSRLLKQAVTSFATENALSLIEWIHKCKGIQASTLLEYFITLATNIGQKPDPLYATELFTLYKKVLPKPAGKKSRKKKKSQKNLPSPYTAASSFAKWLVEKQQFLLAAELLPSIPEKHFSLWFDTFKGLVDDKDYSTENLNEFWRKGKTIFKWNSFKKEELETVITFANRLLLANDKKYHSVLSSIIESLKKKKLTGSLKNSYRELYTSYCQSLIESDSVVTLAKLTSQANSFSKDVKSQVYEKEIFFLLEKNHLNKVLPKVLEHFDVLGVEKVDQYLVLLINKLSKNSSSEDISIIRAMCSKKSERIHEILFSKEKIQLFIKSIKQFVEKESYIPINEDILHAFTLLLASKEWIQDNDPIELVTVLYSFFNQVPKKEFFYKPSKNNFAVLAVLLNKISKANGKEAIELLKILDTLNFLKDCGNSILKELVLIHSQAKEFKHDCRILSSVYLKKYSPESEEEKQFYLNVCYDMCRGGVVKKESHQFLLWMEKVITLLKNTKNLDISSISKESSIWIVTLAKNKKMKEIEFLIEQIATLNYEKKGSIILSCLQVLHSFCRYDLLLKHVTNLELSSKNENNNLNNNNLLESKKSQTFFLIATRLVVEGFLKDILNNLKIEGNSLLLLNKALVKYSIKNLELWQPYLQLSYETGSKNRALLAYTSYRKCLIGYRGIANRELNDECIVLDLELCMLVEGVKALECLREFDVIYSTIKGKNKDALIRRLLLRALSVIFEEPLLIAKEREFLEIVTTFVSSELFDKYCKESLHARALVELQATTLCLYFFDNETEKNILHWLTKWGREYPFAFMSEEHFVVFSTFIGLLQKTQKGKNISKALFEVISNIILNVESAKVNAPLFFSMFLYKEVDKEIKECTKDILITKFQVIKKSLQELARTVEKEETEYDYFLHSVSETFYSYAACKAYDKNMQLIQDPTIKLALTSEDEGFFRQRFILHSLEFAEKAKEEKEYSKEELLDIYDAALEYYFLELKDLPSDEKITEYCIHKFVDFSLHMIEELDAPIAFLYYTKKMMAAIYHDRMLENVSFSELIRLTFSAKMDSEKFQSFMSAAAKNKKNIHIVCSHLKCQYDFLFFRFTYHFIKQLVKSNPCSDHGRHVALTIAYFLCGELVQRRPFSPEEIMKLLELFFNSTLSFNDQSLYTSHLARCTLLLRGTYVSDKVMIKKGSSIFDQFPSKKLHLLAPFCGRNDIEILEKVHGIKKVKEVLSSAISELFLQNKYIPFQNGADRFFTFIDFLIKDDVALEKSLFQKMFRSLETNPFEEYPDKEAFSTIYQELNKYSCEKTKAFIFGNHQKERCEVYDEIFSYQKCKNLPKLTLNKIQLAIMYLSTNTFCYSNSKECPPVHYTLSPITYIMFGKTAFSIIKNTAKDFDVEAFVLLYYQIANLLNNKLSLEDFDRDNIEDFYEMIIAQAEAYVKLSAYKANIPIPEDLQAHIKFLSKIIDNKKSEILLNQVYSLFATELDNASKKIEID